MRVRHLNVLITVRRICWGFWRRRMIVSHTVLLPSWERWLWTNFVWLCLPHCGYDCPRTVEAGSVYEVLRVRSSQPPVWTMNLAVWLCLTGIKTPPQSILSLFTQGTILTLLTRFKRDWFKCWQQTTVAIYLKSRRLWVSIKLIKTQLMIKFTEMSWVKTHSTSLEYVRNYYDRR